MKYSRQHLWTWGTRSVLSLTDQGLTSGSTFLLNVLLARWLSPESYGAFAVAFAGFIFLSGFHNVLFIEPMTVMGPSSYSKQLIDYFGAQMRGHLAVVSCVSALGVLAGITLALVGSSSPLAGSLVAAGVSTPFLLLLWLVRRMCYVVQNPMIAAQASAISFVLLFAGAFGLQRLGWLAPASAFLLMGVVSTVVSLFIFRRLRIPLSVLAPGASPSFKQVFRENWAYGHWLTVTTVLSWMSLQAQTFLAAGFLGLSAAGALRAMQLPSLAMTQVIIATTLIVLPSMSVELGRGKLDSLRQKAVLSSICLTILGLGFVLALFLSAAPLEHLLFGGKYSSTAWLIPLLGLVPVFTGFSAGLSLALRTLRKSEFELLAYVLSSITAVGSALVLMPKWGLPGAAVSIVGSSGVLALAVSGCFLKWGRVDAANVQELRMEEAL